ncbi:MAG: U32 family peptidase, partial [Oscillospiraceae bacterium]|nr:U32 family peptidase [Oscillospiraceae bacterium]
MRNAVALQDRPALAPGFCRVLLCLHVAREEHDRGEKKDARGDDIGKRVKNRIERDAHRGQDKQQHDPQRGVFLLIEALQFRHPAEIGVDALIIADLGVMRLAKRYAPKLGLHVSTQLGVINSET